MLLPNSSSYHAPPLFSALCEEGAVRIRDKGTAQAQRSKQKRLQPWQKHTALSTRCCFWGHSHRFREQEQSVAELRGSAEKPPIGPVLAAPGPGISPRAPNPTIKQPDHPKRCKSAVAEPFLSPSRPATSARLETPVARTDPGCSPTAVWCVFFLLFFALFFLSSALCCLPLFLGH